ncbi:Iron-sulfur cluster assembly 2 like protein mitochondrial [Fasciola gigantica]|uniref:Iron-sulfur cluster assembly 2 homolog, mitochondrial n=1 Tax=Fasciola gigantica TaxID=46835 RepID=A0A504YH70_FASGI|nr:Iron-sulfur cluster assembly 2 like protein mitochondrial [Fasciola gigantica]
MLNIGFLHRCVSRIRIFEQFFHVRCMSTGSSTEIPVLHLSQKCIKRLQEIGPSNGLLRVLVDSGGCSGFQYKFEVVSAPSPNDIIVEREGVQVLLDESSVAFLKGATLDYEEELIRTGFRISSNPVAEKGCSCGSSFAVKLD